MFKTIFIESSINDKLRNEFPDVRFNMSKIRTQKGENPWVELMIVVVPYKDRNSGIGNKFMKRLIELSKEAGVDIFLTPDDSYAEKENMSKSQLIKWYKKLGFEKKRKDDFRSQNTYCYYTNGQK